MMPVSCLVCGTINDYIPRNKLSGGSHGICKTRECIEAYLRWIGVIEVAAVADQIMDKGDDDE